MHKYLKLLFLTMLACSAFLAGCGSSVPVVKPFKMDIQQGNVVTSKMLLQLKPGMTKSQVKFIMGTPLILDSFHSNRWDYFYQMRQAGKIKEQRRVILDFENELLARVRGDVVPEGTAGAETGAVMLPKSVEPKAKEEGLLDKLKFWKSDSKPAEVKPVTKPALKETAPAIKVPEVKPEASGEAPAGNALGGNSDAPSVDVPSVLAVPIQINPAQDLPAVEVNKIEMPAAETTKIEPAKIEALKVEPPMVETPAPVKSAPAKPPVAKPIAEAPKATPAKPVASVVKPAPIQVAVPLSQPAIKQSDAFSFRMDRNLDAKNLEAAPIEATPVANPAVKVKKVDVPPPPPEEEPGYFEKMLEKIGF